MVRVEVLVGRIIVGVGFYYVFLVLFLLVGFVYCLVGF